MKKFSISFLSLLISVNIFAQSSEDSLNIEEERALGWKALVVDFGINSNKGANFPPLKGWGSRNVNILLYRGMYIGKSKKFSIASGVGLGLENYNFREESTIIENRRDYFLTSKASVQDTEYVKSKLSVNYIDIPVELHFHTSRSPKKRFRIAAGAKMGFLLDAHSKVVYAPGGGEQVKEKNKNLFGLESFRYGLTGRIGFGYFNFWGYYSLSNLFREHRGPEVTPYSFGLSFSPSYFFDFNKVKSRSY